MVPAVLFSQTGQARPLGAGCSITEHQFSTKDTGGTPLYAPDSTGVVGVIVARAVLDLAVQALDAAAHGMRVVDVDVVGPPR